MATKRIIGLKDVYVAEVKQDDSENYLCGVPFKATRAIKTSMEVKKNTEKIYSESELEDVVTSIEEGTFELEGDYFDEEVKAQLLNKTYKNGILVENWNEDDGKKDFAIMFRLKLAGNKYKYFCIFSAKFGVDTDKQDFESADSKAKNTTETIKATFKQRNYDGSYRCSINGAKLIEGASNLEEAKKIVEKWYKEVPMQIYKGAPLSESNKPTSGSGGPERV